MGFESSTDFTNAFRVVFGIEVLYLAAVIFLLLGFIPRLGFLSKNIIGRVVISLLLAYTLLVGLPQLGYNPSNASDGSWLALGLLALALTIIKAWLNRKQPKRKS